MANEPCINVNKLAGRVGRAAVVIQSAPSMVFLLPWTFQRPRGCFYLTRVLGCVSYFHA